MRIHAHDVSDECLIWPFKKTTPYRKYAGGHALAWNPRLKKQEGAYRVMWEMHYGIPFPEDAQARHLCNGGTGENGCVNPRHVVPGTKAENAADRILSGRSNRGSRHGLAKLTEEQAIAGCHRVANGESQTSVARSFGVDPETIGTIWRGRSWLHIDAPRKP